MVVQSLKAFERHTELRRLERVLSKLRDRVREARLTPETSEIDRGAQLAEHADALDAVTRRIREFLVSFSDDRVRLNLITEELRQNVIELTMLPVASVFDAFPRAVRDLARTFGKEIELDDSRPRDRARQENHRADRGAADSPDPQRRRPWYRDSRGSQAARQNRRPASLILSAEQQGNRILITLKDDGCGIDLQMLRAVAVQDGIGVCKRYRSLVARAAARFDLPARLQHALVCDGCLGPRCRHGRRQERRRAPGRRRARPIGDRQRDEYHAQLPLSLALLRVVLLEAGEELFALPTAAVRRILQLGSADIGQLQQGPVADVDGESIPLTPLSAMLQVPASQSDARQTVIVAEGSDGRFAILVEAVHEEQELVFKELRGPLRNQKTFTGAALLGNGDIVPILDVNALFDLASQAPSPPPRR